MGKCYDKCCCKTSCCGHNNYGYNCGGDISWIIILLILFCFCN